MAGLILQLLASEFAVCRLPPHEPVPLWAGSPVFSSITRTPEELSIICPATHPAAGCKAERGWRLLKLNGPLDFDAIGILASVATPLAQAGLSLLTVGTFDTDYLLVKSAHLDAAIRTLEAAGHVVRRNPG